MHTIYYIILVVSVALFSSALTLGAYMLMHKLAMLDAPEDRSNHETPTVTGVGLGFMTAILSFLIVVNAPPVLITGAILLLVVSVMDDRTGLSPKTRFGVQLIAVILALHVFGGNVFGGVLPVWADMAITAVLWLWMINLTNFMDGIDELSVTEGVSITGGLVLLSGLFAIIPQAVTVDALVIAIGLAAFYPWNRHPASCFMGDAGSVPLGYLLGYLLLSLSAAGLWEVALILPAYYLTDATLTLAKRVVRGERVWQAHSQHCYQKAVRAGRSHAWVSRHVGLLNVGLLLLAGLALYVPGQAWMAVVGAYALSLLACGYFAGQKPAQPQLESLHETTA